MANFFGKNNFAGNVRYDARGLVSKCKEHLSKNVIEFKLTKREAIIQWIFSLNEINKKKIFFNFFFYGNETKIKNFVTTKIILFPQKIMLKFLFKQLSMFFF